MFHEIKHVLQQKVKTVFVNFNEAEIKSFNEELEEAADNFAMNYLIPPAEYKEFSPNKYTSDDEICAFAKTIGIHPGIVAGRMQHDKIIAPSRCSKLKEKYIIEISSFS